MLVGLTVPGQSKPSVQIAGADVRLARMIITSRNGAGMKLAVIDTGLEICHPDLAPTGGAAGDLPEHLAVQLPARIFHQAAC